MVIHFSILVLLMLTAASAGRRATYLKLENPSYKMPKGPWVVFFGYLAILAALRSGMNDTPVYIVSFQNVPGTWEDIIRILGSSGKDKGFGILANLFKMLLSDNYHLWFLLFAFVESWCFVRVYRAESCSFAVTCFFFFASTLYYNYFSMMRQWAAVALLFAGFRWVYQKKWLPYFVLCILAAQLHNSAYLGIAFYFIVQGKPWGRKQNMVLLGFALAMAVLSPLLNVLSSTMEESTYDYVLETMRTNSGSSPIRAVVTAVPVVMSYLYRGTIGRQNSRALETCVNFAVLNMLLNILASFTSGLYVVRLATYVAPYVAILYAYILEACVTARNRQLVKFAFYTVYFGYFCYQMSHQGAWGYASDILGRFS